MCVCITSLAFSYKIYFADWSVSVFSMPTSPSVGGMPGTQPQQRVGLKFSLSHDSGELQVQRRSLGSQDQPEAHR